MTPADPDDEIAASHPYRLASRRSGDVPTAIAIGDRRIGGGDFALIAGPCAIESRDETIEIARVVRDAGGTMLRGGAYKPRTSPYAFQGLGRAGLQILAEARAETGLPVVTELMDVREAAAVAEVADMIQIGARNMQNYALLTEVGRVQRPVLLKRGLSGTITELLMAAEYIMAQGNGNVMLCERGIRSFDTSTRFTLDLNAVPLAKELTHLPIMVDPSHGTGKRSLVERMSLAGLAAGADGLILEVHPDPDRSLSDAAQTITLEALERIIERGRALHSLLAEEPVFESVTTILRA
jgi:3-deoxy-7-phosphoheptulonate synthase